MIIISKIDIEYYRSLKKVTIQNINHLNIFSGKNDIGKSNVLKALDTFFNKTQLSFTDDYNKDRLSEVRKDSIKGKQFIKITLELKNPGNYKTLPEAFSITKSWDREGNLINSYKDNFDALIKKKKFSSDKVKIARRTLTQFLNKIRFTYIPAIRDEHFFSYLLNKLQETIFEVEERKRSQTFQKNIKGFNETIKDLTLALNSEFENVSGISSSLSFPNNISEIFQRLIIDTQSGEHNIPLRLRGDGIRLRYIPTILNYISVNSKYIEIWGFDEPENSCEYSLSQKIAEQFASEYSNNTQIFVASHSFHFISLSLLNVSKFRVYRTENVLNTQVALIDDSNKNILSEELGILDINKELSILYTSLTKEMQLISDTKLALAESQKPYLIFEGKSDNLLFEVAYKKIFNMNINTAFTLCEHLTNGNGSAIGSSARFINDFLFNHITKTPMNNKVIGIFDFDKTGVDEIKALKKAFNQIDSANDNFFLFQHKTKSNVYAMTIVAPSYRLNFIHKPKSDYCYLTSELLLQDTAIPNANKQYPTLFDKTVFMFSGDKVAFANSIELNKGSVDFTGFVPTFDLINRIISIT
jgi:AAA15 family ATPase/GTPase